MDAEELSLEELGNFRKLFCLFKRTVTAQTVKTTINRLKKDGTEVAKEEEEDDKKKKEEEANQKKEKKNKNEDNDKEDKKEKKEKKEKVKK
jgi:hypothetical protein